MRLITNWRSKPGSLSPREARAGREPERRFLNPNSLLSPALSSLWEEREGEEARIRFAQSHTFNPNSRLCS